MGRAVVGTKSRQLSDGISLEERLPHYRQMAADALQQAANTENFNIRAGYLSMASGWHALAGEIEEAMRRSEGSNAPPEEKRPEPRH